MKPVNATTEHSADRRRKYRFRALSNILAASFLAITLTVTIGLLAIRFNFSIELPLADQTRLSERTYDILAATRGDLTITCYLERDHQLYRPVIRLLKGLRAAAANAGGASLKIVWVDPRRDLISATKLAQADIPVNTLIFEGHSRRKVIPVAMLLTEAGANNRKLFAGESMCAAVLAQLGRETAPIVYWLTGHGEIQADDYDPLSGGSDLAREMRREGFELRSFTCWEAHRIPQDADILMAAGPRRALTADERGAIEEYLQKGGRLLYLVAPGAEIGLEAVVARWGINITQYTATSPRTLHGQDIVISTYGSHEITRNFRNTATVFAAPRCLTAETTETNTVDRPIVTLLAVTGSDGWGDTSDTPPFHFDPATDKIGPVAVAAVAERGGSAGADVAFQATRIAVFGETAFAANELLGARSGANRDLLINVLNWLCDNTTGMASSSGGGTPLTTGFDRRGWQVFTAILTIGIPATVAGLGLIIVMLRRAGER